MTASKLPPAARVAAIASAAMIAQQVAGKATRDAFYLSHFSATTLPPVMGASAVVSLFAALWLSRMLMRYAPVRVVPLMFGAGSAFLFATWGLTFVAPGLAAIALYLYTAIFGAAMISAFWSFINETFDPHTGRRAVAAITGGGTLGGLLGGLAAWRLSSLMAVSTMIPILAAASAVCMWATLRMRGHDGTRLREPVAVETPEQEPAFPLRVLRGAPYLRNLAAIVALGAVTQGLLDYVFSAEASRAFAKGPALLQFFSMFWVVVGVLSFVLQVTLGRLALEKLSLAVNMALLPAIVLLGSAVGLAVPGLASSSLLRGAEATQRNSLFRAAYEMLYTPLSVHKKRAIKTVIDLGFDRMGTLAAAGLAWAAVWLAGARAEMALLAVAMLCAVAGLARSRPLHLGYVSALEESLRRGDRDGRPSATPPVAVPALSRTARDEVVDRLDVVGIPAARESSPGELRAVRAQPEASAQDLADMVSMEPGRVRRVLSIDAPLPRTMVPFAMLWLADKDLRELASRALRAVASHITGQLADALCDPDVDLEIRRRVPRLLATCPTQAVAEALLQGAEDARFEVRYECGRALLHITRENPHIVIPLPRILAIVKHEVSLDRNVWEGQPSPDVDDDDVGEPAIVGRLRLDRVDRSLEHVFSLLALHLDRGSLVLAFRALHSGDDRLRGTALEYLDTVLPDEIRDDVWPHLGEDRPMRRARSVAEILADLEHPAATTSASAAPA